MGILRDISELKATEQQLARVEAKTQEIEDTKTAFMRNMMKEIRQPMQKVIDAAAQLKPEYNEEFETPIVDSIIDNTSQLTHVINNILYLSRLEAHMVEISRKPTDFAMIFASNCAEGWDKYRRDDVRYIVESPYENLVIDIDAEHLGKAIQELALNAAQYTVSGTIRARYDYIGRRLIISIEDTGCGISTKKLQELNSQMVPGYHVNIGLGLPICNELVKQMGGNLELNSELGLGTTAWITIPCQASVIKRKKLQ
jgi:signal transduction histidine kinase